MPLRHRVDRRAAESAAADIVGRESLNCSNDSIANGLLTEKSPEAFSERVVDAGAVLEILLKRLFMPSAVMRSKPEREVT